MSALNLVTPEVQGWQTSAIDIHPLRYIQLED